MIKKKGSVLIDFEKGLIGISDFEFEGGHLMEDHAHHALELVRMFLKDYGVCQLSYFSKCVFDGKPSVEWQNEN